MTRLTVPPDAAGVRLDVWLSRRLPELSRARIQALIRAGLITIRGGRVKPRTRLTAGTEVAVVVPPPPPTDLVPEPIPLDVLFEDDDLIVVNKPPGLVAHPAAGHASGTLANALVHRFRDLGGVGAAGRPGLVHRLDRDTSGVMVVARSERALRTLVTLFRGRAVRKEYLALVWGRPVPPAGRVETLIGRSRGDRKKMSAGVPRGRAAVTLYETVEALGPCTLLRVRTETGRTHQIRVHMAHVGHPVVGDAQYGRKRPPALPVPAHRQMLHARRIEFQHPAGGRPVAFEAPLPPDIEAVLQGLRESA